MNSSMLTRGAAAALTTVVLALGAVACNDEVPAGSSSGSTGTASTASPAASGSAGTGQGTGKGTATSSPTGSAAQASSRCHTGDLKADIQLQKAGSAMVMLTNKGSRTCTVDGYLGYGGLLADNSRADPSTSRVAYPGAPMLVTLKPGTTAFSGLKWAGCDKSDASCKVLAGVVVTPPDETTQLTADVLGVDGRTVQQLPVSAAGFTAGSLQPSNEGVVFS